MDTKWKSRTNNAAWLLLFTFGLSGFSSLLFGNYYPDRTVLYVYVTAGLVALSASLFLFKRVSVFEWLGHGKWQQYYERIPMDLSLLTTVILAIYTLFRLAHVVAGYPVDVLLYVKGLVICAILLTGTIMQVLSILRRFQNQDEWQGAWQRSITYRVQMAFRESFLNRNTGIQVTLLLGIMMATGFGLMVVFVSPPTIVIYLPLFVMVTLPTLFVIYRSVGYLSRIVATTTALVQGNTEPDLVVKGHSVLKTLAENVNRLKLGVATSVAAQAKSERLKTELITNVSHDLRTPLTSIITYTELLKTTDLPNDQRETYIDIIDRKAQRLKVLIDDLFEASKMASGNIELVKERVDMTQLLQQALAENDEAISQSSLQFRVPIPQIPIYCEVDGQKLWRVFDNLIRNALKYSLEGTRVHISIKTFEDNVIVAFKNISKYELSEDIEDLFERFKRGDASRHTDGSGLGLAIAKSIIDLHGGTLDLAVDGDLFKATITLRCMP